MFSFQRFYTASTLLFLITLASLYYVSRKNIHRIYPLEISSTEIKEISSFIKLNHPTNSNKENYKLKLDLSTLNTNNETVIEIDEASLHKATLIYNENGKLKEKEWLKCVPDSKMVLNTKPYFIINSKNIAPIAFVVFFGSSYYDLPVNTYDLDDYFLEKNNEMMITAINIMILIAILFTILFIYFKLKNGYSIFLFTYILLCTISSLLYNGFTNDFWPFNNIYISDHSLGLGLGFHLTAVCVCVNLFKSSSQ
jgi:hypothetical protein